MLLFVLSTKTLKKDFCLSCVSETEIKKESPFLSFIMIIYSLQFEERNFWFDIYSFISLLLFNKNNTWRPTCFIIQTTGFNRPAKFLILLKHRGYDNFE